MKTKDRLKEEIGFDKLLMTIASAMFSSLAGWLFGNQEKGLSIILFSVSLLIVFLAVIIYTFLSINTKIKNLDL